MEKKAFVTKEMIEKIAEKYPTPLLWPSAPAPTP